MIPMVIQYNKRDLPDAMSAEELDQHLNQRGAPASRPSRARARRVPDAQGFAARVLDSSTSRPAPPALAEAPAPSPAPAPLTQAPAQSIASEAPAPQPPLPAPVAMQAPRAPIPAPAASRTFAGGSRAGGASAAQTAHWTAVPAPAPTAGPASIPLGGRAQAPAAGAPAQALPGAGLPPRLLRVFGACSVSCAARWTGRDRRTAHGATRAPTLLRSGSTLCRPAGLPRPPRDRLRAAAHAAVSSSIASASAARPFREVGPRLLHARWSSPPANRSRATRRR